MKLFSTSNMEIITYCWEQFDSELPRVILTRHTSLFLDKLRHCDNCLIKKRCVILVNELHIYVCIIYFVYACVYVCIHIEFVA